MTAAKQAQRDVTGRFVNAAFQVKAERDALVARMAELEAALRNITECAEAGSDGANMDLFVDQARAALAKVQA